jgi:hypothetical protein
MSCTSSLLSSKTFWNPAWAFRSQLGLRLGSSNWPPAVLKVITTKWTTRASCLHVVTYLFGISPIAIVISTSTLLRRKFVSPSSPSVCWSPQDQPCFHPTYLGCQHGRSTCSSRYPPLPCQHLHAGQELL